MTDTTTTPDIEAVWLELQRLNVAMKGWWAEPECAETGEPAYGMEVAPESLTDWEVDGLIFEWQPGLGWTMHDWCTPQIITVGTVVLDISDQFDAPAVAEHLRKVVVGEISEFRRVTA